MKTHTITKPKTIFGAAIVAALFVLSATAALALAPENLPSQVDNTIKDRQATVIANNLFPEVDVKTNRSYQETNFTIGGMHFVAGDVVQISEVTGSDVFVGASAVQVNEEIDGDLFAGGNSVTVNADVNGSVRVAGNFVEINGNVDRNLVVFANTVSIGKDARIKGHANIYAADITFNGKIEKSAFFAGATVDLNGEINGETEVEAKQVIVGPVAVLDGLTNVTSPNDMAVDNQATGQENIYFTKSEIDATTYAPEGLTFNLPSRVSRWLFSFFFFGVIGVILILIWPKWSQTISETSVKEPGSSWGKGLLYFFVVPAASLILFITIIGIPFALIVNLLYFSGLLLGRLVIAGMIGQQFFNKKTIPHQRNHMLASFGVGHLLLSILYSIPFIGWLVGLAAAVWGIGAVVHYHQEKRKAAKAEPEETATPTTKKPKKATPKKKAPAKKKTK
ncbi:hypothetical protein ACFL2M_00150 [Patescibacteria group bacterium]